MGGHIRGWVVGGGCLGNPEVGHLKLFTIGWGSWEIQCTIDSPPTIPLPGTKKSGMGIVEGGGIVGGYPRGSSGGWWGVPIQPQNHFFGLFSEFSFHFFLKIRNSLILPQNGPYYYHTEKISFPLRPMGIFEGGIVDGGDYGT